MQPVATSIEIILSITSWKMPSLLDAYRSMCLDQTGSYVIGVDAGDFVNAESIAAVKSGGEDAGLSVGPV